MSEPVTPSKGRAIAVSGVDQGFAYVPGRVLVRGEPSRHRAVQLVTAEGSDQSILRDEEDPWWRIDGIDEPIDAVDLLRSEGLIAQPEHMFFAHACGGCAAPAWARPCGCHTAAGLAGGLWGSPLEANPLKANPLKANPLKANHAMENTARPARTRELPERTWSAKDELVVVLDTGLSAGGGPGVRSMVDDMQRPPLFRGESARRRVTGSDDPPDQLLRQADRYLDPVAGHGTFIAGVIEQLAPGCRIEVHRVMGPDGVVLEGDLYQTLLDEAALQRKAIVSLSFGGHVLGSAPWALRRALAVLRSGGSVVVASAGNDATCVPQFPAALPGVVAVAALDACGPALFTNYGEWVDACAPGVDLVSAFFADFDGQNPAVNGVDIDQFRGWARWSGTSFAVPVVVAALVREMVDGGVSAREAVTRVIRARHLFRLPCLGTVINI